jgi:hypothetical protein
MQNSLQKLKLGYKQSLSRNIAEVMTNASDSDVVQALAHRIRRCNSDENIHIGLELESKSGETFTGRGTLWACNSRFCSQCVSRLASKTRKIADFVFNQLKETRRRLVVLTQPDDLLSECSLNKQICVFNYALRHMMRHSEFFRDTKDKDGKILRRKTIKGTIKTIEFTVNAKRKNFYHVHCNLLTDSAFIHENKFKVEWTHALEIAFNYYGVKWETLKTANKLANVYFKRIVPWEVKKGKENCEINRNKVVFEICKYVCKNESWISIPPEQIAEVCENPRFFRFFEVTGTCRELARPLRPKQKEKQPEAEQSIENTQDNFYSNDNHHTYFNKNDLIVPNNLSDSDILTNSPPKVKKKSWFWRIKNNKITFDKYKQELAGEIERTIKFRKLQLRQKYGFTPTFFTLDGECF